LQKVLSKAGVSSLREAERLILEGKVRLNGRIIRKLGVKVDPLRDEIKVEGKKITLQKKVYIVLNKPKGYLTTLRDDFKRPKVVELIKGVKERIFPVGRLDLNTTGVLILTNDGELAYRLTHPKFKVEKIYQVKFKGFIKKKDLERLRRGVFLNDGLTLPCEIKVIEKNKEFTTLLITLKEGRKRQIRRMGEVIGHKVVELERISFAGITLKGLKLGEFRHLNKKEIKYLKGEDND
jgi:pseudouridine synthase